RGGHIGGLDMVAEIGETFLQFIEHDSCFFLLELFIATSPVTGFGNGVVGVFPLLYLIVTHVGKYSHRFRPFILVSFRIHGYHVPAWPLFRAVMDIPPYTRLIPEVI